MNFPLVSIIVLTYNSRKHLPALFSSLAGQTYPSLEFIVVDNASSDATVEWINQQSVITVNEFITNTTNEWYSKGNNQGVRVAHGEYIIFCNDDIVLTPTCVMQLMETALQKPHIGMIGGKLLKLTPEEVEAGELRIVQPRTIDSAGIALHRSRRASNRGENEIDTGQYEIAQEIFGITGALMMVSRKALEATKYQHEFFDEDFIAYKEDVDLSWRMHRAGFSVYYQPLAVAYHARTVQQTSLANRKNTRQIVRAYSYRNHWWAMYKNSSLAEIVKHCIWIIPYELSKLLYILIKEPKTLAQLPNIIRGLSRMKRKRIPATLNYSLRPWII